MDYKFIPKSGHYSIRLLSDPFKDVETTFEKITIDTETSVLTFDYDAPTELQGQPVFETLITDILYSVLKDISSGEGHTGVELYDENGRIIPNTDTQTSVTIL